MEIVLLRRNKTESGGNFIRLLLMSGYTADVIAIHGILDRGGEFHQEALMDE